MSSRPCAECVSKLYSSRTRSLSRSWPRFGVIVTSQSITDPLRLSQQAVQGSTVALRQRGLELRETILQACELQQDCLAILQEDPRPDRRIARRNARRVSEAGRRQVVLFRRQNPRHSGRDQVGEVTRQRQRLIVLDRRHEAHPRTERLPKGDGPVQ